MKKIALLLSLFLILIITSGCVKSSSPSTLDQPVLMDDMLMDLEPAEEADWKLQIKNFKFQPLVTTVRKGETVEWTNLDQAQHTITSDEGTELDSPLLSQNETFRHVFDETGTYEYHCTPHPFMKATIKVIE